MSIHLRSLTLLTRNLLLQRGTIRRMTSEIDKEELKKRLTPLQWHVTQEKGTERPFSGCYNKFYERGTYTCIICDQELFSSDTKYDSGCGWPAFNEVLEQGRVKLTKDTTHDMVRTEVTCSKCGSHLGHVFNDGPKPTRKRFCINSASINFHSAGEEKKTPS
ncbi:methionine sulfoxide reductase SelR isoform X2 [Augochlora pura]